MTINGTLGVQYDLDPNLLSDGGEGQIYRVLGSATGKVAKIYKPGAISRELTEKLMLMIIKPPEESVLSQVAWPLDILFDTDMQLCGFIMPELSINTELGDIYKYNPGDALRTLPISAEQKLVIAMNICAVISAVHDSDYVFGDFNPRNIGVDKNSGKVAFLDTDSYHVTDAAKNTVYRCNVCAPGYAAPELLEQCSKHLALNPGDKDSAYAKAPLPTFTKETDNFALAIHIFKLLMNGFNPYGGIIDTISASQGSPGVGDTAVRRDSYCFKPGYKHQSAAILPLNAFPRDIAALFTRAFIGGKVNPKERPSAYDWHSALEQYKQLLVACPRNPLHQYYRNNKDCPYCEADKRFMEVNKSADAPARQPLVQGTYTPIVPMNPAPTPVLTPQPQPAGQQQPAGQAQPVGQQQPAGQAQPVGQPQPVGQAPYQQQQMQQQGAVVQPPQVISPTLSGAQSQSAAPAQSQPAKNRTAPPPSKKHGGGGWKMFLLSFVITIAALALIIGVLWRFTNILPMSYSNRGEQSDEGLPDDTESEDDEDEINSGGVGTGMEGNDDHVTPGGTSAPGGTPASGSESTPPPASPSTQTPPPEPPATTATPPTTVPPATAPPATAPPPAQTPSAEPPASETQSTAPATNWSLDPSTVSFPSATEGYGAQPEQTITLNNMGPDGLILLSVGTTSDFEIILGFISPINADGYSTVRIRPVTGLPAGNYTGELTVTTANGGNKTISLSFSVTPIETEDDGSPIEAPENEEPVDEGMAE